jgi:hypothetical protein
MMKEGFWMVVPKVSVVVGKGIEHFDNALTIKSTTENVSAPEKNERGCWGHFFMGEF